MKKSQLIGKKCRIVSDNENYERFANKTLIITHATNDKNCPAYDSCIYPQMLCDFKIEGSEKEFPFALYEYEFKVLN